MLATLTKRGARWVAVCRRGDTFRCEITADSRQDAAEVLHEISGVWLGLGPAPRVEVPHAG